MSVRLGTRASKLATAQAGVIADLLGAEMITITSEGDVSTASLATLGGRGVFASALREALMRGEVDVLVHSYKDLPTAPTPGMVVAAVPRREDARDALCTRDGLTLDALPAGARIGTGSPRRRAQLAARRPDLELVDIRGNVDTRLERLTTTDEERRLDAVLLAAAGLTRVGALDRVTELLSLESWPTAPGQGALAIEVREGDEHLGAHLDHADTRLAADAERGVLARLGVGCAAPVGAHAFVEDGMLFLHGAVYRPDGGASITSAHAVVIDDADRADAAETASEAVSRDLLDGGAREFAPLPPAL